MLNGHFVLDNPHLSGFEKYKRGYQTHILSENAILNGTVVNSELYIG